MLDCDASFFLVPEFQSSRGARRTSRAPESDIRFGPETGADLAFAPMPVPGILGVTEPPAIIDISANAVPTALAADDLFSPTGAKIPSDAPDSCKDCISLLAEDDDEPLYPPRDTLTVEDDGGSGITDIRAVTPRRPMRFTFARDTTEPGRMALPVQNLFDGVFDATALTGPGIDPRLQRSRARAHARLAAYEATLPPEARNLFCMDDTDDTSDTEPSPPTLAVTATTQASDGADGTAPRRAVRHLSVTRRAPKQKRDPAAIHDPLQDHLHQVRDALYAPDPEFEAEAATATVARPSLSLRLLAILLTLAVTLTRLYPPVRALLADQARQLRGHVSTSIFRRAPSWSGLLSAGIPRLHARATAITGTVFALAQTLPPSVM